MEEVDMSNEETSGDHWISRKKVTDGYKPASLDVLGQVMINIDPETPFSTLRNCIISSKADVSFSKEELRKVEEKLRRAFVEFYQRLRLLKSYWFCWVKQIKEITENSAVRSLASNRITSRNASKSYLEMVDKSYLGSSEEVNKLIEKPEATFIKHFANGNRGNGMKSLKPKH